MWRVMNYRFKVGDYFIFAIRETFLIGRINAINNDTKGKNFVYKPIFHFDIIECNHPLNILVQEDIRDSKCFAFNSMMYTESIVSKQLKDLKDMLMVEML